MKKIETIVAATDFSPLSDVAIQTALDMGARVGAKRVHIIHILDMSVLHAPYPFAYTATDMAQIEESRRKVALEKLGEIQSEHLQITREVKRGIPSRDLASVASTIGADLIVIASHGYGVLRRTLLGSVANALIRVAHCPVLVVGERRHSTHFANVLAAIDLSPVSKGVLSGAIRMTIPGGRVQALSLYETPLVSVDEDVLPRYFSAEEIESLRAEREKAIEQIIREVDTGTVTVSAEAMSKAPAANVILDTAEILGADLIAIGTSGHNAWHRMIIGSTATRVIAEAKVPVLVVPHDATPSE